MNQIPTPLTYYGPLIIREIGVKDATIVNIFLNGVVPLLCSLINVSDLLGRRSVYIFCMFFCAVVFLVIGGIRFIIDEQIGGWAQIVLFGLLYLFYSPGPGNLFWVIVSEIFPRNIREVGLSITTVFATSFSIMLGTLFPVVIRKYGDTVTWGMFCIYCLFGYLYALKEIPKGLKGKEL